MAAVVASMLLYRKFVSKDEADMLHLRDGEIPLVSQQEVLAHRLSGIDRWGKILTIILIAYGFIVGCEYLYLAWSESTRVAY